MCLCGSAFVCFADVFVYLSVDGCERMCLCVYLLCASVCACVCLRVSVYASVRACLCGCLCAGVYARVFV